MKRIVNLSGGKDSTALLLMLLERGAQIDYIVFADTGKDFPQNGRAGIQSFSPDYSIAQLEERFLREEE